MRPTSINWTLAMNCNVCSVDWSRLANYEYSVAALKNTKLVTAFMIRFMEFLVGEGMRLQQVSIAGHSLGAQVAGFVGRNYRGRLRAIYGRCALRLRSECELIGLFPQDSTRPGRGSPARSTWASARGSTTRARGTCSACTRHRGRSARRPTAATRTS